MNISNLAHRYFDVVLEDSHGFGRNSRVCGLLIQTTLDRLCFDQGMATHACEFILSAIKKQKIHNRWKPKEHNLFGRLYYARHTTRDEGVVNYDTALVIIE